MSEHPRRCPVCWRNIAQTTAGNIARHWDSARKSACPMSAMPYELMETDGIDFQGAI